MGKQLLVLAIAPPILGVLLGELLFRAGGKDRR